MKYFDAYINRLSHLNAIRAGDERFISYRLINLFWSLFISKRFKIKEAHDWIKIKFIFYDDHYRRLYAARMQLFLRSDFDLLFPDKTYSQRNRSKVRQLYLFMLAKLNFLLFSPLLHKNWTFPPQTTFCNISKEQ